MDAREPKRLYAATNALWVTRDGARSWREVGPSYGSALFTALAVAPGGATIYAPFTNYERRRSGVGVSTNGGRTLEERDIGLPSELALDVAVESKRSARAYVVFRGVRHGHVFATTNTGAFWTDISGNLPDAPASSIALDEATSPPTIFVASDVGVFVSTTRGRSWRRYGRNLPNAVVLDVSVDPKGRRLVAATHGRGAFVAPLP
jgi:hypothetical protein